jgi:hypothetical protein
MAPLLGDLQMNAQNLKAFTSTFAKLYDKEKFEDYSKKRYNAESQLEGESDEEYEFRNKPTQEEMELGEEGKALFNERMKNRAMRIAELNDQLDADWAANIDGILQQVGYQVDPITYRDLFGPQGLMPIRTRDVINALVNREFVPSDRDDSQTQSILKKLKTDLSNAEEIMETLRSSYGKKLEQNLRNDILAFNESGLDRVLASSTDGEGNEVTEVENLQGENLSNWLAD